MGLPPRCGQGVEADEGLGVLLSPDSPGSDAMKSRTEPGNPEARFITNYS